MTFQFSFTSPYFMSMIGQSAPLSEYVADGGHIAKITDGADTWQIHTFLEPGYFAAYQTLDSFQYMVVAGGGGGGFGVFHGAGGGAGGLLTNIESTDGYLLTGVYYIGTGSGGQGGWNTFKTPTNGNASMITEAVSESVIVQVAGGGAAGRYTVAGVDGGSGGGSGYPVVTAGAGTVGQGYAGGLGTAVVPAYGSGGGGGAGAVGTAGSGASGGNGGIGRQINITGTPTYYAGGGGGSAYDGPPGAGGLGGGGVGGRGFSVFSVASAGTPGTGGGGGGAERNVSTAGGNGGSGIVIIRHKVAADQTTPPDGGTTIDLQALALPTPLQIFYDASNPASYPGAGTTWTDIGTSSTNATLHPSVTYDGYDGLEFGVGTYPSAVFTAFNSNADFTVFFKASMSAVGNYALLGPNTSSFGGAMVIRYLGDLVTPRFEIVSSYVAIRGSVDYTWPIDTDLVVAVRRTGTTFAFYAAGMRVGLNLPMPNLFGTATTYTLGGDASAANPWVGKFKKFGYTNVALSDDQIGQISALLQYQ